MGLYHLYVLFVIIAIEAIEATIDSSILYHQDDPIQENDKQNHQLQNVIERGLVIEVIDAKSILDKYTQYSHNIDVKLTGSIPILGFITPWNSYGYTVSKLFNNKFTHFSPCWFQIRRDSSTNLYVAGEYDIDTKWMEAVRSNCGMNCPKIVPRFIWEADSFQHSDIQALADVIKQCLLNHHFDGLVFELGFSVGILPIIQTIRKEIAEKELILVVHPQSITVLDDPSFMKQVNTFVTHVILMTYDYSVRRGKFYKETVKKYVKLNGLIKNVMLGLPFYGYRDTEAMIGEQYLSILRDYQVSIEYDLKAKEHRTVYRDQQGVVHFIFYPSLLFLHERINLAKRLKCGLSVWELGQGLDYFYDLLYGCLLPTNKYRRNKQLVQY